MAQSKDYSSSLFELEDVIRNLKQIPILILLTQELLDGTSSLPMSSDEILNNSVYLLQLCDMQLKSVFVELDTIHFELREGLK